MKNNKIKKTFRISQKMGIEIEVAAREMNISQNEFIEMCITKYFEKEEDDNEKNIQIISEKLEIMNLSLANFFNNISAMNFTNSKYNPSMKHPVFSKARDVYKKSKGNYK